MTVKETEFWVVAPEGFTVHVDSEAGLEQVNVSASVNPLARVTATVAELSVPPCTIVIVATPGASVNAGTTVTVTGDEVEFK